MEKQRQSIIPERDETGRKLTQEERLQKFKQLKEDKHKKLGMDSMKKGNVNIKEKKRSKTVEKEHNEGIKKKEEKENMRAKHSGVKGGGISKGPPKGIPEIAGIITSRTPKRASELLSQNRRRKTLSPMLGRKIRAENNMDKNNIEKKMENTTMDNIVDNNTNIESNIGGIMEGLNINSGRGESFGIVREDAKREEDSGPNSDPNSNYNPNETGFFEEIKEGSPRERLSLYLCKVGNEYDIRPNSPTPPKSTRESGEASILKKSTPRKHPMSPSYIPDSPPLKELLPPHIEAPSEEENLSDTPQLLPPDLPDKHEILEMIHIQDNTYDNMLHDQIPNVENLKNQEIVEYLENMEKQEKQEYLTYLEYLKNDRNLEIQEHLEHLEIQKNLEVQEDLEHLEIQKNLEIQEDLEIMYMEYLKDEKEDLENLDLEYLKNVKNQENEKKGEKLENVENVGKEIPPCKNIIVEGEEIPPNTPPPTNPHVQEGRAEIDDSTPEYERPPAICDIHYMRVSNNSRMNNSDVEGEEIQGEGEGKGEGEGEGEEIQGEGEEIKGEGEGEEIQGGVVVLPSADEDPNVGDQLVFIPPLPHVSRGLSTPPAPQEISHRKRSRREADIHDPVDLQGKKRKKVARRGKYSEHKEEELESGSYWTYTAYEKHNEITVTPMRYSRRLGERSQSAHRRHLEELSESLPRENRRISYVENKTVKQHSINPLDRDVLSLIESRLSTDNPNLISVLDINNQIHEAEEEEEEYLPPDTIWEDELDNGVYETEEMGHGVLDVNIPPEFEQHSPPSYLQRTPVYKRLQESPEESERRKTDKFKEVFSKVYSDIHIKAEDSIDDLVKKVYPDTEREVIKLEELKFLSVYDSNYMGHGNFALLQLSNDVARKVMHDKVAIPLKIAETGSNQVIPYFKEGIYIYIYLLIYRPGRYAKRTDWYYFSSTLACKQN